MKYFNWNSSLFYKGFKLTLLKAFLLSWQNSKWQKISICKWENVSTIFYLSVANSIKTKLWTCNLLTGRSINYKSLKQFGLNLHKKFTFVCVKKSSHLQMDTFCRFNFFHNIRNGFWFHLLFLLKHTLCLFSN